MLFSSSHNPNWYQALTLTERLASLRGTTGTRRTGEADAEQAQLRLERWQSQAPFKSELSFAERLASDGLSKEDLHHLLGEPIEAVRNRFAEPPNWLAELCRAFSRPPSSQPFPVQQALREEPRVGFLAVIEPLLSQGRNRVHEGAQALSQTHANLPFDPGTVEEVLAATLPRRLLTMLSGTMALELHVARLQGYLKGETPEERFQSFVERLGQPDQALALLQEYPVLARLLLLWIDHWATFSLEFLHHLCADWEALQTLFHPETLPGKLVQVDGGGGGIYRGGRSALIAKFSSGFKVVYKPRSLAADAHFQELLVWLNRRGDHPPFRTLRIVDRGTYGWAEFITPRSCNTTEEVQRFYERQGGYLALLYALEGTDLHFANLIAAGEHPMLIDLEGLFHPRRHNLKLPQADVRAEQALAHSVLHVGLLPKRHWTNNGQSVGIDLSGLGAVAGQLSPGLYPHWECVGKDEMRLARKQVILGEGKHRPTLHGTKVNVPDHADAVTAGFATIYGLLRANRDELLSADGPLARFADDELRAILRPSQSYGTLLRESYHPDLLRDGLDRDRFFDWLWLSVRNRPDLVRVLPAERDDLHQGATPRFTARPGSRDVWSSVNERIADFFEEPALATVRRRLLEFDDEDLAQQLWFIQASLATLSDSAEQTPQSPARHAEPQFAADRERLLASARAVGDRLETQAVWGTQDVTWIGLMHTATGRWSLQPLTLDLYDGLPGVVLFLAYLGALTGEERYTALARAALVTLRRQVLRRRPFLKLIGGFHGWAGVVYAYAHLAALWEEPALLAEAEAIVDWLPSLIEQDEHLDIASGAAGCIGCLLTLYRCAPSASTLAVLTQCGDRLLSRAQPAEQGMAWVTQVPAVKPLAGFGYGAAGIAWALEELAVLTRAKQFSKAARAGIAYEHSLFSPQARNWPDLRNRASAGLPASNGQPPFTTAWCQGAPGIGLARLQTLPHVDEGEVRADIEAALQTTLAQGFGHNHSLCHGDLGNLELLLQAGEMLAEPRWHAEVNRRGALILEGIRREGWRCGTPLQVESPGLMTGLAGIGYGLLRLADPARIPSVLVLAPPTHYRVIPEESALAPACIA